MTWVAKVLGAWPYALVMAVVAALWRVPSHALPVHPVLTVTVMAPSTISDTSPLVDTPT